MLCVHWVGYKIELDFVPLSEVGSLMEKRNKPLNAKTDYGKFCIPNIRQVLNNVGRLLL